jgi:hypothetical protein
VLRGVSIGKVTQGTSWAAFFARGGWYYTGAKTQRKGRGRV